MRFARNACTALLLAVLCVAFLGSARASAHALPQPGGETPAAGATLSSAPMQVSIVFGESPDPRLSRISVFDLHQTEWDTGNTSLSPGNSDELTVGLKPIPHGVYTVSWRTVSTTDGHLATGSYAFGVGVSPGAAASTVSAPSSNSLSFASVIARSLFYAGLMVALGTAFVTLFVLRQTPPWVSKLTTGALACALVGSVAVSWVQISSAGTSLSDALSTSLGRSMFQRGIPILAALVVSVIGQVVSGRRKLMPAIAVLTLVAMLADVIAGHATDSAPPWLSIAATFVHIAAVGVWLGGLPLLIGGLRSDQTLDRRSTMIRFSKLATYALLAVGATGIVRAVQEIGSWGSLFTTTYGLLVVAKSALFLVLLGLGAVNHFVHVPEGETHAQPLRRIARGEVLVGLTVTILAASLVNATPPSQLNGVQTAAQSTITADASDFATTVRTHFAATPGFAGINTFTLHVTDYNTGAPISNANVTLSFQLIGGTASIGQSQLTLHNQSDGDYGATGTNLSVQGQWLVTALIERQQLSTQVQLRVTTKSPPATPAPTVTSTSFDGLTVYTVPIGSGDTVQVYLDPGKPGANIFHMTFFAPDGNELVVPTIAANLTLPGQPPQPLTLNKLDAGHYSANVTIPTGTSRYTINATSAAGAPLNASIAIAPS